MKTMKRKMFFLLLVFLATTSFGQTLTLTTQNYDPVVISTTSENKTVNIRSMTELTIVASGGGETYWTVGENLVTTETPSNPEFPITNPTNNTVTITIPLAYENFVLTVYFASPVVSIPITLVRNDEPIPGLLNQQNVRDCPNTTRNFLAADYNENFDYQWEEWNGSWVSLIANPNYSENNHSLTLQVNSSTLGKRFRAMVKNRNCLGAIDYTGEVVVLEVYERPTFTISDNMTEIVCSGQVVTYSITVTGGTPNYTVSLIGSSHPYVLVSPNNQSSVNLTVDGDSAQFDIMLSNPPVPGEQITGFTTTYVVVDQNGCYGL